MFLRREPNWSSMERLSLLLILLWYGAAGAFFVKPAPLASRRSTLCVRRESFRTFGRVQHARHVWPQTISRTPRAGATTSMSSMLLAKENASIVPPEQQESLVSVLSVASSALLLLIVMGAVYLTYSDWQNKRDMEKAEKFIASTGELPELATQNPKQSPNPNPAEGEGEEEAGGNRQFRRMAKKERKKSKS